MQQKSRNIIMSSADLAMVPSLQRLLVPSSVLEGKRLHSKRRTKRKTTQVQEVALQEFLAGRR